MQAVTPQNEVDTDQDGRMPACIWPQEYEMQFVKLLGPLLQQNGLATQRVGRSRFPQVPQGCSVARVRWRARCHRQSATGVGLQSN